MTTEASLTIGKAKITVEVVGCYYCGTIGSDKWQVVRYVPLVLNGKEHSLRIDACGDCLRTRGAVPQPMDLGE